MTTFFRDSRFYTAMHPLTITDAYKAYAAYAGIHDVHFNRRRVWAEASLWDLGDGWTVDPDEGVICETAAAETMAITLDGTETLYSFVVNIKADGPGSIIFRGTTDEVYFEARWTDTDTSFLRIELAGEIVISSIPIGAGSPQNIKLMVREYQNSSNDDDKWLNFAIWYDEEYILAGSYAIGNTVYIGNRLGFIAQTGTTIEWTEFFHPVFAVVLDWASLDPGESPMAGLERAVGRRYLRHFARFDGSMQVIRPTVQDADYEIEASRWFDISNPQDQRGVINHISVWGAFHRAEAFDHVSISRYGHRFAEENNPDLYTEREAVFESETIIDESAAAADNLSFSMPWLPNMELEDVIETVQGKYIIESFDLRLDGQAFHVTVNCRGAMT
jgi:hypothetical protein